MRPRFLVALLAVAAFAEEKPAPTPQAMPEFAGELSLVRYDLPRGLSDGYAPTRQIPVRRGKPDGVEWPDFTLNGVPIFRNGPQECVPLRMRRGGEASSFFQLAGDEVVQPGNHWFRPIATSLGRKYLYTADKTARCDNVGSDPRGRWELWLFPVRIEGEGGPQVRNVELRDATGGPILRKSGPWRSLTLLLPANAPGERYSLSVNGHAPVQFNVGLMLAKPGNPVARTYPVDAAVPGEGPKIRVFTPARPEVFPHQKEWSADQASLAKVSIPAPKAADSHDSLTAPASPVLVYAAALPQGMSGGFWKKGKDADEYALRLAEAGFDAVFEPVSSLPSPVERESLENRAEAFAQQGIRLGLQYDQAWSRPSLQHPNLAFLAHTLPEWHQPLYRSLQLAAQRFARVPNFAGIMIGGENAGYASSWTSALPAPNRPWGEAMIEFTGTTTPWTATLPDGLGNGAPTTADFVKWVDRYDAAFHQYGYFAEAVRAVDPNMVFTTGSFGSSPGAGARGGWPWASLPGRIMFEGLPVQQAYDWNELHSSKPMHLVALVDRLRSDWPRKPTWALVDNSRLFFGREAWQRATALVLTRGVRGIGTNYIVTATGANSRPDVVAAQREMATWIHQYAAMFAATEPEATVGVLFGSDQALFRAVNTNPEAPMDQLVQGSHEGKVTEALWLCQAAGLPARVVTWQELMRGSLPASMKALLLVGLDQPDNTWSWGKGLEPALQRFVDRGGRIYADAQSVCPVAAKRLEFPVAAYVTQSDLDATPRLLERNRQNIEKLRVSLEDMASPIAASDDPTLWAVPTRVRDLIVVTALNWAYAGPEEAGEFVRAPDAHATRPEVWKTKANASLYVKPRSGILRWNTSRPIYDLRAQRFLTNEQASTVDFSRDSFQWYALPPEKPQTVELAALDAGSVRVDVKGASGAAMRGIPLTVKIESENSDPITFSALSGDAISLGGISKSVETVQISATELLSGVSGAPMEMNLPAASLAKPKSSLAKFIARKTNSIVVALTSAQMKDPALQKFANDFANRLRGAGRSVRVGVAGPQDVVESLQPLKSPHRYPQWKTVASDLVLVGTPRDNVLILDQLRGEIFPTDFEIPSAGKGRVIVTKSSFVGECDVLNIIAQDAAGAAAAVAE
jgi:hypothetical protein